LTLACSRYDLPSFSVGGAERSSSCEAPGGSSSSTLPLILPARIRRDLALADILNSWKLKSGKVACVLPAHTVFTRVVPLDVPGGLSGQVDAVARFEAQQNIPFPLEEVVWDYVVMGELPSGTVNTVFLAVKTDLLESLCSSITAAGLQIVSVTTAPGAF